MKLKAITGIMLTLFVVSIAFNVVPVVRSTQYIKIGVVGPMGRIQWDGLWEGAQMARDEINDAGGINISDVSYNIQLVDIDEPWGPYPSPDGVIADLLAKLEDNPDMQFLIGGFRSECVFPMREFAMDYAEVNGRPIWFIVGAATDALIDCGNGTCGHCVRCDYNRYKYMFRVNPVNTTTLLNTLVAFLKDHVLPQELTPIYGSPVKTYIVAENLVWCDGIVASLQGGALGTQAEIVGVARPSPVAMDFTPVFESIEAAEARLVVHLFSAGAGANFIWRWGQRKVTAVPVGINVASGYVDVMEFCPVIFSEYESFLAPLGTKTPIIPGVTDKFWDDYVARYAHAPIRTAWGAYDAIMALAETLGNPALVPTWPMTCDELIPIIEQTNRTGILGKFKYTKYHDVFCNEVGSTWTQGYVRPLVVQWQAGRMEVIWPRDKPYSRNYKIPPWMYEYTLTIHSLPTGVAFTVDGLSRATPWLRPYSEGASVSLVMPETYDGYVWSHWLEDGDTNRTKTVTMDTNITLTAVYACTFDVVLDDVHYPVSILSNSTVSNFNFNQTEMQISFNVTGESGTTGYCNVTIPKSLLTGSPWTIKIDNTTITEFDEKTTDTHTLLYFTYTHESPLQVTIKGTWVAPEFPLTIILPLFMILSLTTVVFVKLKKKRK